MSLTGRSSSKTRGTNKGFSPDKHVRDSHGRFSRTAGTKQVSGADARQVAKVVGRVHKVAKETEAIKSARREVLADLGREQRMRLASLSSKYGIFGTEKPKLPTVPKAGAKKSIKRTKNRVEFSESGTTAHLQPHHSSFQVLKDPKHSYEITHEGVNVKLNQHKTEMRFLGERVQGVPSPLQHLKKASDEQLLHALADSVHGANKGNAPEWTEQGYGKPDVADSLIAKRGMGVLQIHHVNQWVKDPSGNIEADFAAGHITEAQRQYRHHSQIEKAHDHTALDPKYQLKIAPKGERAFVILPGGIHDFTSPLYKANHPYFLHPDTGKLDRIGIPDKGDGGREWFDSKFRKPFWKEYNLHHAKELATEVDRRIKAGKMIVKDAKDKYESYLKTLL